MQTPIFALLASVILGSRQTFLSLENIKYVANATETILDDVFHLDLEALAKDWEGRVLYHPSYPTISVRIKEPKLCDNVKQYSGYLDTTSDKHFFFWFFESRNDPKNDPFVLWLNGGPGCSSMTGLLMELGPCRVDKHGNGTTINPYSWNENANVLFLDQPLNAGFSYGSSKVNSTVAASEDVHGFLQLFFKQFPQYRELDFHIFGESYGGHYVPEFAKHIFESNYAASDGDFINLKSIGVGNGLTDPLVQSNYYPKMACHNSYKPVLTKSTCNAMINSLPKCKSLIQTCYRSLQSEACTKATMFCNQALIDPYMENGLNPYDVRKPCGDHALCYDIVGDVEIYLNSPHIKNELGARNLKFESCNRKVNRHFIKGGDWMMPFVRDIPTLLEGGVRVLIYAGDADFICNWMGNKAWTKQLAWTGQKKFSQAKDKAWVSLETGKKMGEIRSYKNFAFLRVFEAGHMVPYDQPAASSDMFTRWLKNLPFDAVN